jgi:response regulator RpfG family c-di-GMP phosphodiesterase
MPIRGAVSARVLIVDQRGDARGLCAGWLQDAGLLCVAAEPGEALSVARQESPAAAVISVGAPDDGGMWIVRSLRSLPEPVGVVVVASRPDFDVAVAASRLGVVDCLPGTDDPAELVDAVRRAVLWHQAMRALKRTERRLQDEVTAGRRHLEETLTRIDPESAQTVLLAIMESRSPDLAEQAQRVARMSVVLARALDLSPVDVNAVHLAGLFHDVGKLAMPAHLLEKRGALSDDDVSVMRTHVGIGSTLLSSVETLAAAAPLVAATHERVDGTGYPAGLAGEAIPMGARIVAVAEAYDTLTSARGIGEPMTHDEAAAELLRLAGAQFDSEVVRAWIGLEEMARCS